MNLWFVNAFKNLFLILSFFCAGVCDELAWDVVTTILNFCYIVTGEDTNKTHLWFNCGVTIAHTQCKKKANMAVM